MEKVSIVPIWVLFPDLDPYLWSSGVLSKMSSKIGRLMFADVPTTSQAKLTFARAMIEVYVSSNPPLEISLNTPFGPSTQRVEYQWIPHYCSGCGKMGHLLQTCKKNKPKSAPIVAGPKTGHGVKYVKKTSPCLLGGTSVSVAVGPKPSDKEMSSEYNRLGTPTLSDGLVSPSLNAEIHQECNKMDKLNKPQIALKRGFSLESGLKLHVHTQNTFAPLSDPEEGEIDVMESGSDQTTMTPTQYNLVVHCKVKHLVTGRSFFLSVIYGSNDARKRQDMWNSMTQFSSHVDQWTAMGDFNVVRHIHEKISNHSPILSELLGFNSYLLTAGLDDIRGIGNDFTWFNKQDSSTRVYSKLDRILVNDKWLQTYSQTTAHFLAPGISNHCLTMITFHDNDLPRKQFKFLDCSAEHPKFHSIVAEVWAGKHIGNSMFRLMSKLKEVKKQLTTFNSEQFTNIRDKISKEFWKLKDIEIKILSQSAKLHNIQGFNGPTYSGLQSVGEAFDEYYQQLLGSSTKVEEIDPEVVSNGPSVAIDDHASLIRPVTRSEIQQALFAIDSNKSPGLDGFSVGFFKAA
ncbi:uncharacterized protein LOC141629276 [Silene latifolia]|uniref:uncharacterized protein LOC141629276 n=1 Tax=Silene latifolia TaxID=37657 RepID=UPI003D77AAC9